MMTTRLVQVVMVVLVQLIPCLSALGYDDYYTQQLNALINISLSWKQHMGDEFEEHLIGWSSNVLPKGYRDPVEDSTPCFREPKDNWLGVECLQLPKDPSYSGNFSNNIGDKIITIVGLTLKDASISGGLPESIADLAPLMFLTLTGNPELKGFLPRTFDALHDSLITLDLHDNNFSGHIPDQVLSLIHLRLLDLSNNKLIGSIPENLNISFPELQTLDLSGNKFNGTLHYYAFQNLKSLNMLDLSNNDFTGVIPTLTPRRGKGLSMIKHINLSRNAFSQNLSELVNVTFAPISSPNFATNSTLRVLDLSHNNIWGSASNFHSLISRIGIQIQEVYLQNNKINGTLNMDYILSNIGKPATFRVLNLSFNAIDKVIITRNYGLIYYNLYNSIRLEGNPLCNIEADYNSMEGFSVRCFCQHDCQDNYHVGKIVALKIALGTSVPCVLLVALVAALFYRKRSEEVGKQHKYDLIQMQKKFDEYEVKPTIFTYKELEAATQNFHPAMKLGEGSYGAVYKGELSKSSIVAVGEISKPNIVAVKSVKQRPTNSEQDLAEFLNEVALISGMKHRNLVKLKGCCLKDKQRLLVYEYVDNHDLEWHLFDGKTKELLHWPQRLRICVGVAHGLHYLHALAQPKIIHRDIKAANILLDDHFEPKIADFGLAFLFPEEASHIMTIHVAGTKGYLAPEYASFGQLSEKADVYSFGVVCLEIVSGRRNIDMTMEPDQICLANWALKLHREGRGLEILDPRLQSLSESQLQEVQRVILTALLCLQYDAARRPLMANAVALLCEESRPDIDIDDASTAMAIGFDEDSSYLSSGLIFPQPGLGSIREEDSSKRVFEGQSSTEASLYQRQRSRPLEKIL